MKSLTEQFRDCIATESETGMLIAADAFQDSNDRQNNNLGELLRLYCDIQSYVRTSLPIPQEMGFRFEELNKFFGSDERRYIGGTSSFYSKPLGPYYTGLSVGWQQLVGQIGLLSDEPVRYLQVTNIVNVDGIDLVLRNYRIESMFELDFQFGYRHRATAAEVAKALSGIKASSLRRLTLRGLADPTKVVEVAFRMATGIPKGCTLLRANSTYDTPRIVRTKK